MSYGFFDHPSYHFSFPEAVLDIERTIDSLVRENEISAIFIEGIQLRKNIKSFCALAQLQGVLINLFTKNKYLYGVVEPSSWQAYCKARGRTANEQKEKDLEQKNQFKKDSKILSIQYVKSKYGVETLNDNIADSICIGDYVVNNIKIKENSINA